MTKYGISTFLELKKDSLNIALNNYLHKMLFLHFNYCSVQYSVDFGFVHRVQFFFDAIYPQHQLEHHASLLSTMMSSIWP